MPKRVHEIAKELNKTTKDIISTLKRFGIEKTALSNVNDADIEKVKNAYNPTKNINNKKGQMEVRTNNREEVKSRLVKPEIKKETAVNKLTKSELEDKNNKDTLKNERSFAKDGQKNDRQFNKEHQKNDRYSSKDGQRGERNFSRDNQKGYSKDRQKFQNKDDKQLNQRDSFKNDRDNQKPFSRDGQKGKKSINKPNPKVFKQYNSGKSNDKRKDSNQQNSSRGYGKDNKQGIGQKGDRANFSQRSEKPFARKFDNKSSSDNSIDSAINQKSNNRKQDAKKQPKKNDYKKSKKAENQIGLEKLQKNINKKTVKKKATVTNVEIPEKIILQEFAKLIGIQPSQIIKKLFLEGKILTLNDVIDFETAEEIALEYDITCEKEITKDVIEELLREKEDPEDTLVTIPPVVCVMGHVDHGKTSLLDCIRNTNAVSRESGGITQHIGASQVERDGRLITFLDTPGHEAFMAMRLRGAQSTNIAILVVAADDGVMPQTIEAISHAKAAGIEIIVAINKIDKPAANIDRVKKDLSEHGILVSDWGGDIDCVPVSAHTGEGIDDLLDMVLLTADILDLKANPNRNARGVVLEAKMDPKKGKVASLLVQKGRLKIGDAIAVGSSYGRIRSMINFLGKRITEAEPSTPVEVTGLSEVPNAGDTFIVTDTDKEAKNFAETYQEEVRKKMLESTKGRMSLDDLFQQIKEGNLKEINIIVKADVQGSVEAVKQSLENISNEEVVVKVIHAAVGTISESDVILASASNAIIIGFNVRIDSIANEIINRDKIDCRLYSVIYKAIEDIQDAMKGMLEPIYEEQVIGKLIVRQTFKASGVGIIAGCFVESGHITNKSKIRLTRKKKVLFDGELTSLKHFKDEVKEVKTGFECGIVLNGFQDIQVDDTIEAYIMVEVERK